MLVAVKKLNSQARSLERECEWALDEREAELRGLLARAVSLLSDAEILGRVNRMSTEISFRRRRLPLRRGLRALAIKRFGSVRALARAAGLPEGTVGGYVRDCPRQPRPEALTGLARALGLSAEQLRTDLAWHRQKSTLKLAPRSRAVNG